MTFAPRNKILNHVSECHIQFGGLVQSSIRARLTAEMLKYLIHQRGQIPLSYEQVKRDFDVEKRLQENMHSAARRHPLGHAARRKQLGIQAIEDMIRVLHDIFNTGHLIKEVLFSFGATIMSPKELYRICFPIQCYDGKILTWNVCRMVLFQNLVSTDVFGEAKAMSIGAKLSVLVLAPRESGMGKHGLVAKPMFKISKRGKHYVFNFQTRGDVINPDLSCVGDDNSFDISGVEPLDVESPVLASRTRLAPKPQLDTAVTSLPPTDGTGVRPCKFPRLSSVSKSPRTEACSSGELSTSNREECQAHTLNCVLTGEHDELTDVVSSTEALSLGATNIASVSSEYMWFQFPVTMTGFRDTPTRSNLA